MSRGTDRLAQDLLADAVFEPVHEHGIDRPPEQVFESGLQVREAVEGVAIEIDQEVDPFR